MVLFPLLPRTASWPPVAFLLLVLAAPLRAQPAPEGPGRFVRWLHQDAAALVRDVGSHAPVYVLGAAVLFLPASQPDERLGPEMKALYRKHGGLAAYLDATNELGGSWVKLPVAALAAVSLATPDARFQDAAFTSLQALLYAGVLSYGVKLAVGRLRPSEGQGAYRFAPFSGNNSFPSGHATAAFAIVTPWVLYYPGPLTYGLFALSTGTAAARLAYDKHWTTDVLAGGTLGFFTAYWLTRRHEGRAGHLTIAPNAGGLQVRMRF